MPSTQILLTATFAFADEDDKTFDWNGASGFDTNVPLRTAKPPPISGIIRAVTTRTLSGAPGNYEFRLMGSRAAGATTRAAFFIGRQTAIVPNAAVGKDEELPDVRVNPDWHYYLQERISAGDGNPLNTPGLRGRILLPAQATAVIGVTLVIQPLSGVGVPPSPFSYDSGTFGGGAWPPSN